jgi:hypothetical protein
MDLLLKKGREMSCFLTISFRLMPIFTKYRDWSNIKTFYSTNFLIKRQGSNPKRVTMPKMK